MLLGASHEYDEYESIVHRTGTGRTFEDVTVLQLLSIRTLSKTLLERLEGFRAQRVLAGWTSNGDGGGGAFRGDGSGSVGGSYAEVRGASEYVEQGQ